MADVDLSLVVRESGVAAAIAKLDNLTGTSRTAAQNFRALNRATTEAFQRIKTEVTKGASSFSNYDAAVRKTGQNERSLAQATKTAAQEYRALTLSLGQTSTAMERIRALGGKGGLAEGIAQIKQLQATLATLNADPIRDLAVVEAQMEAAAEKAAKARAQRERERNQQQQARMRASQAEAELNRARWERELAGMSPVEAAQKRLVRATQELAVATRLKNLADQAVAKNPTAANYERQAAAAQRATAAIRGYTQAKQEENRVADESEMNAFQSSYSYFMLGQIASRVSQTIMGFATNSVTASREIERAFADVDRTFEGTERQLESLRSTLYGLSTTTPNSFIDLAEIATLGNQLGIAAEDIESFTRTLAQYTAVSGESAETAATAFGRISNLTGLTASEYDKLASSITYVARTTVATESTIQNTAKEIAALSAGAGFSAESIVGLAGALSSLAIPPERARGALSLYFGALNQAVAMGGPKMEAFSKLTGMGADALADMVRNNQGQEVFLAFVRGLSELDTVDKTVALDMLGLSTIRVDQSMRALAQNVPLVEKSFDGASQAFHQNIELGNQYAIIQETLDSKFKQFQNAVQNAAGAMGDSLVPALRFALEAATNLLVGLQDFLGTPVGKAFASMAGAVSIVVAGFAGLVGALALAKAGLVVLQFAIRQLGWDKATSGLKAWTAATVSSDAATRKAALSTKAFGAAARETGVALGQATAGAKKWAFALDLLKAAGWMIAISATIDLIARFSDTVHDAIDPSRTLAEDLSGLKDALVTDNPGLLDKTIEEVGTQSKAAKGGVSDFNASILTAIEVQRQAEGQIDSTSGAIDRQKIKLGEASKEWIASALKEQDVMRDIIDGFEGVEVWDSFVDGLFGGNGSISAPGNPNRVTRDDFEKLIFGGLDVNELSQMAITKGKDVAIQAYREFQEGFEKANPGDNSAANFGKVLPGILDSVVDAYKDASVEAALSGTRISESGKIAVGTAADFNELGEYIGEAAGEGAGAIITFEGLTNRLGDFQNAIQKAMDGTVGFDSVLKRAQETSKALADEINKRKGLKGDNAVEAAPVDISGFKQALDEATAEALTFYDDIVKLAQGGNQMFALQLAELGPEAQGILSGALKLDDASAAELEAAARFAAFLASDAFKNQLQVEMADANEAYARVLQAGGTLEDVYSIIAAQVAGPEAMAEIEKQWAINHPTLPLNVLLLDPSPEEIEQYKDELSGRLVVTPEVQYSPSRGAYVTGQTYTDTTNGAKITLPADLDGAALSKSLEVWKQNQHASPEELAALLNQEGLSASLDAWREAHGPVTIRARILPDTPYFNGSIFGGNGPRVQKGGEPLPAFAKGGGYGVFSGPGTGTSDSILARVSRGEFISTDEARRFWGTDFFNDLNRKVLPESIQGMIAAAAVSGNQGPSHITNVHVTQVNPVTRDPLKQLRESSEMLANGIWGG